MPEHRDRRHDAVQKAKACRPEGSLFGTFSGRRASSPGLKARCRTLSCRKRPKKRSRPSQFMSP